MAIKSWESENIILHSESYVNEFIQLPPKNCILIRNGNKDSLKNAMNDLISFFNHEFSLHFSNRIYGCLKELCARRLKGDVWQRISAH
jgi:hypothetical protein